MYTHNSSYRTRATVAIALFLFAGLCSALSGPISAEAQEAESSSLQSFSEGGAAVAQSATGTLPATMEIDTDFFLFGCSSGSTSQWGPTLALVGDVSYQWRISEINVVVSVPGGRTEYRTVDVPRDTREFKFLEPFDVKKLMESGSGDEVRVTVYVYDSTGKLTAKEVRLKVDADNCTYEEIVRDTTRPSVRVDAELANCDTNPEVTVTYTITDAGGIDTADLRINGYKFSKVIDLAGSSVGETEITGEITVPVELHKYYRQVMPGADSYMDFYLRSYDTSGNGGSDWDTNGVYFESCELVDIPT